jgi:hypothetical protein
MLHATTHFRPLLKETVTKMGAERFFVLDGVGGLLGVPAGENRGAASEILRELKNSCGMDGVHFTEVGYANLTRTIISAFAGIRAGTLTKSAVGKQGISGHHGSFFWRGFVSPVGQAGTSTDRPHSREQPGGGGERNHGYGSHGPGRGAWPRSGARGRGNMSAQNHQLAGFRRGGSRGHLGPHHHPYHR